MDAGEILDQLTHAEGLPKAALQAASAQRADMVPAFLHEIDSYLALDSTDRADANAKPPPCSQRRGFLEPFWRKPLSGNYAGQSPLSSVGGFVKFPASPVGEGAERFASHGLAVIARALISATSLRI
jgi:hypothetical protein